MNLGLILELGMHFNSRTPARVAEGDIGGNLVTASLSPVTVYAAAKFFYLHPRLAPEYFREHKVPFGRLVF